MVVTRAVEQIGTREGEGGRDKFLYGKCVRHRVRAEHARPESVDSRI